MRNICVFSLAFHPGLPLKVCVIKIIVSSNSHLFFPLRGTKMKQQKVKCSEHFSCTSCGLTPLFCQNIRLVWINELNDGARSVASNLCDNVGDFFLKVGPVTTLRLAVPAAKWCCYASCREAVCLTPEANFFKPWKLEKKQNRLVFEWQPAVVYKHQVSIEHVCLLIICSSQDWA